MKYFKKTPNITNKVLEELDFKPAGKHKNETVYKRRVDLPFNINPFSNIVSNGKNESVVLTASNSEYLKKDFNSKCRLYTVGINVDLPVIGDIILTNSKSVKQMIDCIILAKQNHDEYGKFILSKSNKKPNIQIIKKVKNFLRL
mgnify:CR=1 FL=1